MFILMWMMALPVRQKCFCLCLLYELLWEHHVQGFRDFERSSILWHLVRTHLPGYQQTVHHIDDNICVSSMSRLVSGPLEQWRCVCVWWSSAVLCWGSEISLRKQCNSQTPAGQQLHRCCSDTHQKAVCSGRHQPDDGRAHPCTGV